MIATMTLPPQRLAQPQDHRFSHNANSAGAPLPLIPRRASTTIPKPPITSSFSFPRLPSLDSSLSSSLSSSIPSPRYDSDSSSSTSSPSNGIRPTVHTKRVRGVRTPEVPASIARNTDISTQNTINHTTRPAISRPIIYTPGMSLRMTTFDSPKPSTPPDSHPAETSAQGAKSPTCDFPREGRLVRKKSGQLVKSSLKSSKSATRNSLSVVTVPLSSKSEPTTPMQKAVHFDAQLEHVKLFLAEQKPLAVSRDGSPTDDTSGTDSDFPKFIYGEGDDRRPKKKLLMQVTNMPSTVNPNLDVALESLSLASDGMSILGRVRVRNIAFTKCVAIRFTFDSWQTTSEVTGRYIESMDSAFDRFSFTIRLNDLLARIEGKTFVMAIRYSVAGQDIWDNNHGQNYLATFTKCKAEATGSLALSDEEAYTDMADLRSKLEKVSQSDDRTGPAFLSQQPRRQSTPSDPDSTCFRTSASFASRYDFAASLKSPWDPSKSPSSHARNQSFPLTGSRTSPSLIHWPQRGSVIDVYSPKLSPTKSNMGSPRDIGDDAFSPIHHQHVAVEDNTHIQPYTPRNNRGYFDITSQSQSLQPSPVTLRRTRPGALSIRKVSSDNVVFSPPLKTPGDNIVDMGGDSSELSTPSLFTPSSSSRSSTPSPTEIFMSPLATEDAQNLSPDTHYRQFINKFCFFTGQGTFFDESTVDLLPRTQSVSDIEELLSGISPRLPFKTTLSADDLAPTASSPTRSSSLDDLLLNRSGSLTPTISRLALMSASGSITISASVARNVTPVVS